MQENTDQENPGYGHFLHRINVLNIKNLWYILGSLLTCVSPSKMKIWIPEMISIFIKKGVMVLVIYSHMLFILAFTHMLRLRLYGSQFNLLDILDPYF